jgi:hypothetical protein
MKPFEGCSALVDGHVHLHRCFDIADALDVAANNFRDARSHLGLDETAPAVAWLVEHDEEGASDRLMATLASEERWQLLRAEGPVLHLRQLQDGERLTLIRGQQVRTGEDLEILVVGGDSHTPSGLTLMESIEASLGPQSLVMIPWGFGKWTGSRGRLVMQAYEQYADQGLRLADTGAHTRLRRALPAFGQAQRDETPIMAGSDPFPFPGQHRSIGRTGFVLESVPSEMTWPDVLLAIRSLRGQPRRFGSPWGLFEFVSLQGRMQLRKRLGGATRGN